MFASPSPTSPSLPSSPALVLSTSLLSMTAAGTTYWAPSLAGRLPLSPSDKALFTAAIGVGYITCVLPGLIQTSLHPRSSALLGSLSLSLTYLLIAAVLHLSPPSPIFFLFPLALCISMSSYLIYGSSQTAALHAFSHRNHGAVNGLCSAVYALSSGILGSFETAFFPSPAPATVLSLVLFVATFALLPAVCALVVFPSPIAPKPAAYAALATPAAHDTPPHLPGEEQLIRAAYVAVVCVALATQLFALLDWRGGGGHFLGVRVETLLAAVFIFFLAAFCAPALRAKFRGRHHQPMADLIVANTHFTPQLQAVCDDDVLPLSEIMFTHRFIFLFLMLLILAGCGGLTFMNTVNGLVASRVSSNPSLPSSADTSRGVRALVVIFSAFSVGGRLTAGLAIDNPPGISLPEWRFVILQLVAAVLAVAMLICAFAYSWLLLVGAALVGFAHGTFFSTGPAVCQDFFGVATFARNFAFTGVGAGVGASVMAYIASLAANSHRLLDTSVVGDPRSVNPVCIGTACYALPYCLASALMLLFLAYSVVMRRRLLFPDEASPLISFKYWKSYRSLCRRDRHRPTVAIPPLV